MERSDKYRFVTGRVQALLTKRFWSRVQVGETDDACWVWTGGACSNYAVLNIPLHQGDKLYAHVVSFFLHNGRWPADGKIVCHTRDCTSRECVNPAHLYEGTHHTNAADREFLKYGAAA